MPHVYCLIQNGRVEIHRKRDGWPGNMLIGTMTAVGEGEPVMTLFPSVEPIELTLNDLEIIQDNWNQLEEMQKKS